MPIRVPSTPSSSEDETGSTTPTPSSRGEMNESEDDLPPLLDDQSEDPIRRGSAPVLHSSDTAGRTHATARLRSNTGSGANPRAPCATATREQRIPNARELRDLGGPSSAWRDRVRQIEAHRRLRTDNACYFAWSGFESRHADSSA